MSIRYRFAVPSYSGGDYNRTSRNTSQLNPRAPTFVPQQSSGSPSGLNIASTGGATFEAKQRRRGRLYLLLHGNPCNYCGEICLDPADPIQREEHLRDCLRRAEETKMLVDIEISRGKECGICLEIVMSKPEGQRQFGILPSCNHCFCLQCITTWRKNVEVDDLIRWACPECRTVSNFVCPTDLWIRNDEEKRKIITEYVNSRCRGSLPYF